MHRVCNGCKCEHKLLISVSTNIQTHKTEIAASTSARSNAYSKTCCFGEQKQNETDESQWGQNKAVQVLVKVSGLDALSRIKLHCPLHMYMC